MNKKEFNSFILIIKALKEVGFFVRFIFCMHLLFAPINLSKTLTKIYENETKTKI